MEKIALVTDSTSDLNKEIIENYDIKVLPLRVIYKDREYLDRVDITPTEVYESLDKEVPHTSLPSIENMETLFTKLENEGYTHAIVIPISSGLSGTYNTFNLVSQHYTKLKINVFDSKSLTLGTGALIIKCAEMIEEGFSYADIVESLPKIRNNIRLYFIVDTLKYLIRGGRIGKVSGTVGELLNIKPVISVGTDGVYYTHTKVRGKKKALNKLFELGEEFISSSNARVWVMHGAAEEECLKLMEQFKALPNVTSLDKGELSPVAGVHSGPGLVGVVFMKED